MKRIMILGPGTWDSLPLPEVLDQAPCRGRITISNPARIFTHGAGIIPSSSSHSIDCACHASHIGPL